MSRRSIVRASITDTVPGVSLTVTGLSVPLTVTVSKNWGWGAVSSFGGVFSVVGAGSAAAGG